jgi:hypothetical protein
VGPVDWANCLSPYNIGQLIRRELDERIPSLLSNTGMYKPITRYPSLQGALDTSCMLTYSIMHSA